MSWGSHETQGACGSTGGSSSSGFATPSAMPEELAPMPWRNVNRPPPCPEWPRICFENPRGYRTPGAQWYYEAQMLGLTYEHGCPLPVPRTRMLPFYKMCRAGYLVPRRSYQIPREWLTEQNKTWYSREYSWRITGLRFDNFIYYHQALVWKWVYSARKNPAFRAKWSRFWGTLSERDLDINNRDFGWEWSHTMGLDPDRPFHDPPPDPVVSKST